LYVFGVREGGFGSGTRQPTLLLMTIVSYSEHARLLVRRAEGEEEEVAGESPTGEKLMSEKPTSRQLGEYRQPEP
jgi:hypothetical protein